MEGRAEEEFRKNNLGREKFRDVDALAWRLHSCICQGESRVERSVERLKEQERMLWNVLVFFNMDKVVLCWIREAIYS